MKELTVCHVEVHVHAATRAHRCVRKVRPGVRSKVLQRSWHSLVELALELAHGKSDCCIRCRLFCRIHCAPSYAFHVLHHSVEPGIRDALCRLFCPRLHCSLVESQWILNPVLLPDPREERVDGALHSAPALVAICEYTRAVAVGVAPQVGVLLPV
eukprot:SAG22_NODE_5072_length_1092_cov_1.146022_2_plen_155_part_01